MIRGTIPKAIVVRNFSRCAHLYDKYANVQHLVAHKLLEELPQREIENILEIGCGTGNYTSLLRKVFKSARIKALDISEDMISVAGQKMEGEKIEFLVADAETFDLDEKFDLITSNAVLHWFNDLEGAMSRFRDGLVEKGEIVFSIFGPLTFYELDQSLREVSDEGSSISSRGFLNKGKLQAIMEKHFKDISIKKMLIKEAYPSLADLLKKIKYTGVRGNGADGFFSWRRELVKKLEESYRKRCGRIEATYQIFLCSGTR